MQPRGKYFALSQRIFKVNADFVLAVDPTERATLVALCNSVQKTQLWPQVKSSCFCMAGFLQLVFTAMGREARVEPCYAVAIDHDKAFALGYKSLTTSANQVDGHVVCVVDNNLLLDFGATNIRKYFIPDFPIAIATQVRNETLFPAELHLPGGRKLRWRNDWVNPDLDSVMKDNEAVFKLQFSQYLEAAKSQNGPMHQVH